VLPFGKKRRGGKEEIMPAMQAGFFVSYNIFSNQQYHPLQAFRASHKKPKHASMKMKLQL
jgi:hypothetical protein